VIADGHGDGRGATRKSRLKKGRRDYAGDLNTGANDSGLQNTGFANSGAYNTIDGTSGYGRNLFP
jgi:hypothetical protein